MLSLYYYYYYNHFTALWTLSGTTRVSQYEKKHSPTHTYCGHQSSLICFLHLLRSMASSLFNLRAWQSFSTISKFSLVYLLVWHHPLHTLYFTQSLSSFHSSCPYHRNLFYCRTELMSSNPCLSLNPYNLGFIHIYFCASILYVIFPLIKPFNLIILVSAITTKLSTYNSHGKVTSWKNVKIHLKKPFKETFKWPLKMNYCTLTRYISYPAWFPINSHNWSCLFFIVFLKGIILIFSPFSVFCLS